MDHFRIIVFLLPVVFLIHDLEEIFFFKPWILKNRDYLRGKHPFLARLIIPRLEKLSVTAFSIAVFEEFILLCLITFFALYLNYYILWLAVFMAFSIHIVIHIAQWLIIRRYIPTIVTSLMILPYSIYGLKIIIESSLFTIMELILWAAIGTIAMIVNLIFAHNIAEKLDKKYIKTR